MKRLRSHSQTVKTILWDACDFVIFLIINKILIFRFMKIMGNLNNYYYVSVGYVKRLLFHTYWPTEK